MMPRRFLCVPTAYFSLWEKIENIIFFVKSGLSRIMVNKYRIRSNYRAYPYKRTVKKFLSLQITASVIFLYFFLKAYVVGTHLNCVDLSMQFK